MDAIDPLRFALPTGCAKRRCPKTTREATRDAVAKERVSSSASVPVRLVEWNVYWAALDDTEGRAALVHSLDSIAPADFVAVIEAEGDTPAGKLSNWTAPSKLLRQLTPLTHRSRHETIALFYDAGKWAVDYQAGGEFTPGRPWLLASFVALGDAASSTAPLWIMAVHFPHFLDTSIAPGGAIAGAFDAASAAGGGITSSSNMIITGDFNEFEWEDNPCVSPFYPKDCRARARKRMAPLWEDWLHGSARDVVPNHTCAPLR